MFWAWLRNVLSMIEECSEPERGWSEAGLGMIWVRTETGPGLNQDLFRTCLGPTGTIEMPKFGLLRLDQCTWHLLLTSSGLYWDISNFEGAANLVNQNRKSWRCCFHKLPLTLTSVSQLLQTLSIPNFFSLRHLNLVAVHSVSAPVIKNCLPLI